MDRSTSASWLSEEDCTGGASCTSVARLGAEILCKFSLFIRRRFCQPCQAESAPPMSFTKSAGPRLQRQVRQLSMTPTID